MNLTDYNTALTKPNRLTTALRRISLSQTLIVGALIVFLILTLIMQEKINSNYSKQVANRYF